MCFPCSSSTAITYAVAAEVWLISRWDVQGPLLVVENALVFEYVLYDLVIGFTVLELVWVGCYGSEVSSVSCHALFGKPAQDFAVKVIAVANLDAWRVVMNVKMLDVNPNVPVKLVEPEDDKESGSKVRDVDS
jgi:hypothetical protein